MENTLIPSNCSTIKFVDIHVDTSKVTFLKNKKSQYYFKINDYIYYVEICAVVDGRSYILYDSNVYTSDSITAELKKYYVSTLRYYNFTKDFFRAAKKINNNLHNKFEFAELANKIKDKFLNFNNITINLLLYGNPGTGKSFFIEYMANLLKTSVYILDNYTNNREFLEALKDLSSYDKIIILVPELDKNINEDGSIKENESGILEFLNGCYTPSNSVIMITCNDIAKIESNPILSRPGRIHFKLKFGNIKQKNIKNIVKKYYPNHTDFSIFDKYIDKVTLSEFSTAIINNFILDKPLDNNFKINKIKNKKSTLYM